MISSIRQMATLIIKTGIKLPKHYFDITIELPRNIIEEGYRWLGNIEEVGEYKEIRSLCSEEIWNRYEAWCETDFLEYKLLEDAKKNLRRALMVRNRPDLYKTSQREKYLPKNKKSNGRSKEYRKDA